MILTLLGVVAGTLVGIILARKDRKNSSSPKARHRRPRTEFSKKLLYANFSVVYMVIIFTMVIVWRTGDTSPLSYLIPSTFTLASVANGYYYWKAKAENIVKYGNKHGQDMVDRINSGTGDDY